MCSWFKSGITTDSGVFAERTALPNATVNEVPVDGITPQQAREQFSAPQPRVQSRLLVKKSGSASETLQAFVTLENETYVTTVIAVWHDQIGKTGLVPFVIPGDTSDADYANSESYIRRYMQSAFAYQKPAIGISRPLVLNKTGQRCGRRTRCEALINHEVADLLQSHYGDFDFVPVGHSGGGVPASELMASHSKAPCMILSSSGVLDRDAFAEAIDKGNRWNYQLNPIDRVGRLPQGGSVVIIYHPGDNQVPQGVPGDYASAVQTAGLSAHIVKATGSPRHLLTDEVRPAMERFCVEQKLVQAN